MEEVLILRKLGMTWGEIGKLYAVDRKVVSKMFHQFLLESGDVVQFAYEKDKNKRKSLSVSEVIVGSGESV